MERISQGTMTSAWGFLYFRFFQSKISILIKLMMVALKRKPNFVNNQNIKLKFIAPKKKFIYWINSINVEFQLF